MREETALPYLRIPINNKKRNAGCPKLSLWVQHSDNCCKQDQLMDQNQ